MTPLAFHPLAAVFPLLEGEEFDALVADIQTSGLCEAVWLYEGQILDGRNRYRACQGLGLDCATREYDGDDPIGFVVSMNLRRRHLDESQRGMVAARLANMRQGARTDLERPAHLPEVSQQQAAAILNVSERTVRDAKKVQREAAPAVITAVDHGELTITAALPLIQLPSDEQPRALETARQEAHDKKVTAERVKSVVSRTQVVNTVKQQLAAGKTPRVAVNHALEKHEVVLPTPALADAIAQATDRQVTLPATDGVLHDGRTKAEEQARAAQIKRLFQLFNALEALATLTDLEGLIDGILDYSAYRVEEYLDQALSTLTRLATLWKAHRDAETCQLQGKQEQPSLVPAVPAEPQRSSQLAPARVETADAQPQPPKIGADYDTTRFYLGKPCRHGHTYGNTGQMLRRQSKGDCIQCHQEWKRSRPQAKPQL